VIQVLAVVFLFVALLNGHRELTVLLLVVISIVAGVKVWRNLSPAGITYDMTLDRRRAFPGEQILLSARIKNAKILPVLADISPSFAEALQPADHSERLQKGCSLLWFQEAVFKWPLTAAQRGVYRVGTADLKVGDLFGFYSRQIISDSAIDVVVYPRLIPLKSFRLPRLEMFGTPGIQSPIEDPVYVYGTREYQSGRPARFIHWKASARLSRLQERICEPAAQEKVLLTIDVGGFNQNQAHQDFERMLEVAGALAVNLDRDGIAVGLATNGDLKGGGSSIVPIGRGREQIPGILETLARLSLKSDVDLRELMIRSRDCPTERRLSIWRTIPVHPAAMYWPFSGIDAGPPSPSSVTEPHRCQGSGIHGWKVCCRLKMSVGDGFRG
jgi:uncharacterized protein (DUF58 family)